jgi:stearoyl-CoA desaturase (delta-9 desaturase)
MSLPFDFVTLGELFQNNHHKFVMSPDLACRWFEIDPAYPVLRFLAALGIIQMPARRSGLVGNAG